MRKQRVLYKEYGIDGRTTDAARPIIWLYMLCRRYSICIRNIQYMLLYIVSDKYFSLISRFYSILLGAIHHTKTFFFYIYYIYYSIQFKIKNLMLFMVKIRFVLFLLEFGGNIPTTSILANMLSFRKYLSCNGAV